MIIKSNTINDKSTAVIEFSVEASVVEEEKAKIFHKKANSFNVPGFRRGKAPRSVIEKMYGTGVFLEDAVNEIINNSYSELIASLERKPVGRPDFDIVSFDEKELVIKMEVAITPDVKIEGYKGIEVSVVRAPVTDEEIDAEINTVRERNAREIEITDRAAAIGDTAVIDYEGSVDGVPFDGGKDSGHHLKLGSGQFIPGFEEGIVGKNVGDSLEIPVTFPEDYHAAELAGKAAIFKVKINALTYDELPELDDDFAVDVSEFNTLAEYRADVTSKIGKRHDDRADADLTDKIEKALADKVEAEIPEAMVDSEVESMVRDGESRMQQQGLDFKTYLQYFNMTLDQYKEQVRPSALTRVKTELALEKITEIESLTVSDDEIDEEYKKIAEAYNVELPFVKENLPVDEINHSLLIRAAVKLVKDAAVITYLDKEPEVPVTDEKTQGDE